MLNKSSKQTGSVHIIVTILIALAILGGIGFILWNNFLNKNPTTSTPRDEASQNSQSVAQVLKLDDWSIKLTAPAGLALGDIYYYKTHVGEGPDYYGFTTNRVRAEGGYCDNQVTGNLVTLTRSTSKSGTGTLLNEIPINGYYFYSDITNGGVTPTPECLTTDAANNDRTLLSQMIKTVSPE